MNKKYLIIILLSPLFWWTIILNFPRFITEISKDPFYISTQSRFIFSETNLKKVDDLRWYDQTHSLNPFSQLFFNKITLIINETFEGVGNFGPKTFFFSGDSAGGSPKAVEPIPLILLPVSFLGILRLLKHKSKILLILPVLALIPLLTGQSTLFYLFPVGFFYIHAGIYELSFWKDKHSRLFLLLFILYSLYLISRSRL